MFGDRAEDAPQTTPSTSLEYAGAATRSAVADPPGLTSFLSTFARHRNVVFGLVALLFLVSFNGQWRIGRDSAIYRQIARNLARSHTYTFRDKDPQFRYVVEKQEVVYPGLPLVLAGVERAFGGGAVPALVLMYIVAAATLWLTYALARDYFPRWLAVIAVLLLGVNRIFLEQSNDIQTDLPFLFGLLLSLYGYERLRRVTTTRARLAAAVGLIAPGLAIAATMRPTFWMLAIAWVLTSLWGLIVGDPTHESTPGAERKPRPESPARTRAPAAIALGTLVTLALLAVALDPRTKGFNPTGGGYEQRVAQQLHDLGKLTHEALHFRLPKTLEEHLPQCFFALTLKQKQHALRALAWAYSLMLVGCGAWLLRVNRLWGLLALVTIASLIVIGDVPRYYMMILPLLIIAWLAFCHAVARRMTWFPALPALAMLYGVAVVAVPNFVRSLDFVREQRGLDRKLHHHPFLEVYEDGKKLPLVHMADLVRQHAAPNQRVIGPEPVILTYLSDRTVYGLNSFLPKRAGTWGDVLRKLNFAMALFPPGKVAAVYDKDDATPALIASHMLLPGKEIARTPEGIRLCEVRIRAGRHKSTKGIRLAKQRAATSTQPTTQK